MKKILLASVLSILPFVANAENAKAAFEASLIPLYFSDLTIEAVTSISDLNEEISCKEIKEFQIRGEKKLPCEKIDNQGPISCEEANSIISRFSSYPCTFSYSNDVPTIRLKNISKETILELIKINQQNPIKLNIKQQNESLIISIPAF